MRRLTFLMVFSGLLATACVSSSTETPPATRVVETVILPPVWTITATSPPTATKTPSPHVATSTNATPTFSPTLSSGPISLLCPPAGNLTEIARSRITVFSHDVDISGKYAYVAGNAGLWIFDIEDPGQPTNIGFKLIQDPNQILVADALAYGIDEEGLWLLDLSDPAAPTFVSYKDIPDMPLEFEVTRDYVFIRDNYGNLRAFDLSRDANLREVSVYDPPGEILSGDIYGNMIASMREFALENPLHSFSIHGDYAYVADLDAGLRILNISDPTNMREVGSYEPSASISDVEVIQNFVFIFGIHQGSETYAWDLWVQNSSALLTEVEPEYLGTISIPRGTKSEILCVFISDVYRLISESSLEDAFAEIQPEEFANLFKGVVVVDDLIYVADAKRGFVIYQFEQQEE